MTTFGFGCYVTGEGTESEDESYGSNIVDSTGGKTKFWQPIVTKEFVLNDEATFESIEAAIEMYRIYTEKAGFDVRLNTTTKFGDDTVKKRYVVCNRNGKIPNRSTDTLDTDGTGRKKRNSNFRITDCKAMIKFERGYIRSNVCKVVKFVELHNHPLDTKEERRYSKRARKLTYKDKEFIVRSSTSNIGETKAHKLQASLRVGYDNVGPEVIDYKIFRRKVGNIIGDRDAQLVVDKMEIRKNELPNYTFEYKCVDSVLNAMFWADETDKMYYKEFGDVISFDATFRTNKYGMVFVPFTAIDNHKRSINIGAGLLSNESRESYWWLLEAFLKAHGKQPKLVLTNQDPAVLQAVEAVLPESNHRLCMWHIMKKLQAKVSPDFLKNTNFKKCFNKLVWNVYLEPVQFEAKWKALMKEYKLEGKRWFKDMYGMRDYWIPAYFKDMPLHGLMKTTSRSESANSFFNKYANPGNLLTYFMMNFDTAIKKQRNTHRKLERETKKANHELKMPTGLEQHALEVYTKTIYLEVRNEIYKGMWNCSLDSVEMINGWKVVIITHLDKRKQVKTKCKVELKLPEKVVKCSCQLFNRTGIFCRHVFSVLKNNHIDEIPEQYILRRWRRGVISSHLLIRKYGFMETKYDTFKLLSEAYSNIEYCMEVLKDDKNKLVQFVENTRIIKKASMEIEKSSGASANQDEETILKMFGVKLPDEIQIHVPTGIRNKGSGTKKGWLVQVKRQLQL